ncbi:MAG TPA: YciI family protein [Caulobacteraceae bacterium]|nr:YciI family protein [Caulobacteraceae bacterium]
MAHYAVVCHDKPGALPLRTELRPKHREYLASLGEQVLLAGPLLDDQGLMCGSLFVIEAADEAGAEAFSQGDPFRQQGVFGQIEIKGFSRTMGTWGG